MKKSTLAALAMGIALATAPVPVKAETTLALGLSSPCHGLLALRGVLDWEHVGIQADLGIGFTSLDFRYKKKLSNFIDAYGYIGAIGVSPWIYALAQGPVDGPVFGLDLGGGLETSRKKGLSCGIEGGLVLPIPPEPNTGAFRFDVNLMYKIPYINKKK